VYVILQKLKKRGIADSRILEGKKSWHFTNSKELAETLYELKKSLLQLSDGREEVVGVEDSTIVVHRGKEAVRKIFFTMFMAHKQERFLALTDVTPLESWLATFTQEEINETNRIIKKNSLITELIVPMGWLEDHFNALGDEWARDYEGRTSSTVYADKKYFNHSGQIFAFKDSLYLLALDDQLVIEIRHSDIQKMILAMYSFIKDHGVKVDANKRIREMIEKKELVKKS
jgi:hypothetical protein